MSLEQVPGATTPDENGEPGSPDRARAAMRRVNPEQSIALGQAARVAVPHERHAEFVLASDRMDPISLLEEQAESRVPELVPVRHGRMLVSPFTFFRGAAAVMAADLVTTPTSGLPAQLCGDAHLLNFGLFGSPERRLLFDINDFDETHPGPWEWDLKRLAASIVVAGRDRGFSRKDRRKAVMMTVERYREAMAAFAGMPNLDVWYASADVDEIQRSLGSQLTKAQSRTIIKTADKARTRDSMQAMQKLTTVVNGQRRIIADPPLIVPIGDLLPEVARAELEAQIRVLLDRYSMTLPSDRRVLFHSYEFVDMARKVVGVGSVGTRCWVVLLRGRDDSDPLFLQVKEAQRSVLAGRVTADPYLPTFGSEGERVVHGQRLMQAASDIFLGWEIVEGIDDQTRDFYVRQLRDWKGSMTPETMIPAGLTLYGATCGWTLARAHARSGNRIAISTYLGDGPSFAEAITAFSEAYADVNEQDHRALAEAVRTGRLEAVAGV